MKKCNKSNCSDTPEKMEATCLKQKRTKQKKHRLRRLYFKTLFITLGVLGVLLLIAYGIFAYAMGGLNRTTVDESKLSINAGLAQNNDKVINVALYGIDSREHDFVGRSDAIMIASFDYKHAKIKLVSVARDTYVNIPDHGQTRINHAYSYGGPELAIQTLNETFDLDITDYVAVNFDSLAEIIDELGGVDIDVTEEERQQINAYLLAGEPLRETGMVHLNGPQAVSYARIRKIDSDTMRASRQREVLECLFEKAKTINPVEYPSYIRKLGSFVETSLTNDEILGLASIAAKTGLSLEHSGFPNDYIESEGRTISGAWYYIYDLDYATAMLHAFLYDDIPFEYYGLSDAEIEALQNGADRENLDEYLNSIDSETETETETE